MAKRKKKKNVQRDIYYETVIVPAAYSKSGKKIRDAFQYTKRKVKIINHRW